MRRKRMASAVVAAGMAAAAGGAELYRNLAATSDGVGTMSTNTVWLGGVAYRHIGAGGQPGGIFTNAAGEQRNYAGFLQAADVKKWKLDHDGDGVPDELEDDNDSDGLADASEIQGAEFDPTTPTDVNVADTDGDGMSDGAEAGAGSNPTDKDSLLVIADFAHQQPATNMVVRWQARSGKTYEVAAASTLQAGPVTGVVGTVTVSDPGALPPWYETSGTFTNVAPTNAARFYRVQVKP
jgi:hypothetical protein